MTWLPVAAAMVSLCFSLWVMRGQTTPEGFLARNGIVFLGIGMVAGTIANLFAARSALRGWLTAVMWAGLAMSLLGLYLRTH